MAGSGSTGATGKERSEATDPLFNQSLEKGLAVLRAFDPAHRTLTLAEVARLADMSKGSAQRAVHTLEVLGYIGRDRRSRRFRLLPKVIELGFNYLASHPLVRLAHPYLAQLARTSGETASLTEPVGQYMVYMSQIMTTQSIPVLTPVGMRIPMYCTSSGRAYLSRQTDQQARALLEAAHREARTPATLTGVDDILQAIRTAGRWVTRSTARSCFSATWASPRPSSTATARPSRGAPGAADQPLEPGRGDAASRASGGGVRAGHFRVAGALIRRTCRLVGHAGQAPLERRMVVMRAA